MVSWRRTRGLGSRGQPRECGRCTRPISRISRGRCGSPCAPTSALSEDPRDLACWRPSRFAVNAFGVPLKVAARVRIPLGVQRQNPLVSGFSGPRHPERPDADTAKIPREVAGSGRTPAESPPETRNSPYGRAATLPCRHLETEAVRACCPRSNCRETRRHHRRRRSGALLAIVLSHEKAVTSSGLFGFRRLLPLLRPSC